MPLIRATIQLLALVTFLMCGEVHADSMSHIIFKEKNPKLSGYLCIPAGLGPFPAVIYNHGGLGHIIGGPPEETCKALAALGFIGFSPIRRKTRPLNGHLDDIQAALRYIKNHENVVPKQIAMMGFSRGALLTLMAARKFADIKAIVLMASAMGRGHLKRELSYASEIRIPVLVLVGKDDRGSRRTHMQNLLGASKNINLILKKSGVNSKIIIYPKDNFNKDNQNFDHTLFFKVGDYWPDVTSFIKTHLKK